MFGGSIREVSPATINIPIYNFLGSVLRLSGLLTFSADYHQTAPAYADGPGGIEIVAGAHLDQSGQLITSGSPPNTGVRNDGEIDPGGPGAAGDLEIAGPFKQTSTGLINVDIGGTSSGSGFDHLSVSGAAVLGGTLAIHLSNGFTPALGQSFRILDYASYQGSFASVSGLQFGGTGGPYRFSLKYNPTNVTLTVVSNTTPPPPVVTGLSVTTGSTGGGTSVVISGSNFSEVSTVNFGGVPATTFTVNSSTQITATSPPEPSGTVDAQVVTPGGISAVGSGDKFTYVAAPAPSITQITPASGSTSGGALVTIVGSNFSGATGVSFGGTSVTPAGFTVLSDTAIVALAPANSPGTVDVSVTTPSGTSAAVSADRFTYALASAPSITGVSPNSGGPAGGTVVTISGSNLGEANGVSFGGIPASSLLVDSSSQITAMAPPSPAGTYDITVSDPGGTSPVTPADRFTYNAGSAPSVTGESPNSGSTGGGTQVTLSGSGFTGVNSVSFGTTPATNFSILSDTSLLVTAPAAPAGVVDIRVTSPTGTSATTTADQFTYTTASVPSLTSVSPASGNTAGGEVVTVNGAHFSGATAVSFGGTAATNFTVVSDSTLIVTAPAEAAGTVDITVTTPSGTSGMSSADHFTYTAATAPAVTAVSPNTGATVGGALVTIAGSNFTGASAVSFGSLSATWFSVASDNAILVLAPAESAGIVDVRVTTPSGQSAVTGADQFTYTATPVPVVSSITPASGSTAGGTVVTVAGSGFTGASDVLFGGIPSPSVTVNSDSQITAVAPPNAAGTWDV
jgi:hypothetical protein